MIGTILLSLNAGTFMTVTCWTDRFAVVNGGIVEVIDNAGEASTVVTNSMGRTPSFEIPTFGELQVTLSEQSKREGLLVGTTRSFNGPNFNPDDYGLNEWQFSLEISQPLASRETISGSETEAIHIAPSEIDPVWGVHLTQGSGLRFSTSIAFLPNSAQIGGVLQYFDLPPEHSYGAGLYLDMPTVHLGDAVTMLVSIDCNNSVFSGGEAPILDAFLFREIVPGSPWSAPLSPLAANLVSWEDSHAGISLKGTCQKGKLLLLLRDPSGSSGGVQTVGYNPRAFVIPGDSSDGTVMYDARGFGTNAGQSEELPVCAEPAGPFLAMPITNCVPVPANPSGEHCEIAAPSSPDDCSVTAMGPEECQNLAYPSTSTKCGPAGLMYSFGKTTQHTFGFLPEVSTDGLLPLGGSLNFEYKYESTKIETSAFTATAGANGAGQCFRWFTRSTTCKKKFNVFRDKVVYEYVAPGIWSRKVFACAKSSIEARYCSGGQVDEVGVCDRTN